jgi:hypothetical protein
MIHFYEGKTAASFEVCACCLSDHNFLYNGCLECSQLIWQRGTFDVNDLMNNTIGALVGGLIAVVVINGTQRHKGEG